MINDTDDRDEQIRLRAYAIWVEEGRPEGKADEHWRMASDALEEEEAAVTPLTPLTGEMTPILTPIR